MVPGVNRTQPKSRRDIHRRTAVTWRRGGSPQEKDGRPGPVLKGPIGGRCDIGNRGEPGGKRPKQRRSSQGAQAHPRPTQPRDSAWLLLRLRGRWRWPCPEAVRQVCR